MERRKRDLDRELDTQLEDTFPASDALKITRFRPDKFVPPDPPGDDESPDTLAGNSD